MTSAHWIRLQIVFIVFTLMGCNPKEATPTFPVTAEETPTATAAPVIQIDDDDDFLQWVSRIEKEDSADAARIGDGLWSALTSINRIPLVFDTQVYFLYKGNANTVTWRGDFTSWERGEGIEGRRLGSTDLWLGQTVLPDDVRANYKVVVDGEWMLDPANRDVQAGGLGDNNILTMPQFTSTSYTSLEPGISRGNLSPDLLLASHHLGYEVQYRVYTPADYEHLSNLPVLYVTDGNDWAYEPYGAMTVVLDNLIASGDIRPVIAVFLDAREPEHPGNNRRELEFLERPEAFARFVAEELVPVIDATFRTDASAPARVIQGTSYGGVMASYIPIRFPQVFGKGAIFSPAFWILESPERFPPAQASSIRMMYATLSKAMSPQLCQDDDDVQCLSPELNIFMSAGIPDWDVGVIGGVAMGLRILGMPVRFMQAKEGHNWGQWRDQLDEMLTYFFPPPLMADPPVTLDADAQPMLVDTDMAPDDWLALLYLLQNPRVDVLAITVSGTGETHCQAGVQHARDLAALVGRAGIPVACGREKPLAGDQAFPDGWRHRADTLAGMALPANPVPIDTRNAGDLMVETVRNHPVPLAIVTLGPLTNIADALHTSPDLADNISSITIMGGALAVAGNVGASTPSIANTAAEWNLYIDPQAATEVLESSIPVTLIPLDATDQVPMTAAFYQRLAADRDTAAAEFAYRTLTSQLDLIEAGLYWFWDPLAAAISIQTDLAEPIEQNIQIVTTPGAQWGATRMTEDGLPVRTVHEVDAIGFEQHLLDVLNRRFAP